MHRGTKHLATSLLEIKTEMLEMDHQTTIGVRMGQIPPKVKVLGNLLARVQALVVDVVVGTAKTTDVVADSKELHVQTAMKHREAVVVNPRRLSDLQHLNDVTVVGV